MFAVLMMHLTFGLAAAADWRAGRVDSRKIAFLKNILTGKLYNFYCSPVLSTMAPVSVSPEETRRRKVSKRL